MAYFNPSFASPLSRFGKFLTQTLKDVLLTDPSTDNTEDNYFVILIAVGKKSSSDILYVNVYTIDAE
ncbi:hypothetical protein X801_02004 [Opisthorchis viverrini]|uniref:Uncharacterized protein n=2 Tax=Opisthorchis viverrini TaxID=6198 RepID=A0A1S8X5T9_OPIVI|nr:hypothetical protein T265_01412 [Opisthorchis viverrini]KER32536.1 hypothetical protein T265_01412 [Opisthorchis viverrini]OON22095.1 hypothetical protein X801_02004 [Opisthorchis viverrini]